MPDPSPETDELHCCWWNCTTVGGGLNSALELVLVMGPTRLSFSPGLSFPCPHWQEELGPHIPPCHGWDMPGRGVREALTAPQSHPGY